MSYVWHIAVLASLYSVLALSLNLSMGFTGLLSLCHAAFFGVGAYTTALLMLQGWGFFPAILAAVVVTALLSLTVAVPSIRLKGDYFVLATLGLQVIVFRVLENWVSLTGGANGLLGFPAPALFGLEMNSPFRYALFGGAVAAACCLLLAALTASPFGRVLKAVREDEIAAAALGKNVPLLKVLAFTIGAAVAAVPGGLFAGYFRFIDPGSFTLMESTFILGMVIIGGAGSLFGPVLGAAFLVFLPEALRFLQFSDAVAAPLRQIIYGVLLILLMRLRPQGLQGDYTFA